MELPEHTHKTAQDIKHPVSGEHGEDGVALCPSGGEGSGGAELLLCVPVGKVVAGSQPQPVSVVNHIIADKPPSADQEAESRNHKPRFSQYFQSICFLLSVRQLRVKTKMLQSRKP